MKCSVRRILRVVVMWGMAVSAGYGSASLAAQPPLNPQDYPRLDDKQLGHIRHMLKLSSQPPGEWTAWARAGSTRSSALCSTSWPS